MNEFAVILWACLVVDVLVPGVDVALGWYILWLALAMMAEN